MGWTRLRLLGPDGDLRTLRADKEPPCGAPRDGALPETNRGEAMTPTRIADYTAFDAGFAHMNVLLVVEIDHDGDDFFYVV